MMAVALTAGFYALAIAIAGGLLIAAHRLQPLSVVTSIIPLIGAVAIIASIFPRFSRFVPPGPRLVEREQPDLFASIREVAAAMKQPMPDEIYLHFDVNAGVVHRGGFAGVGGRRIMGLGLPLLQALSVAQWRAVIAHELGHYRRGDAKLAPWIYHTREAIIRTIEALPVGTLHLAAGSEQLVVKHSLLRLPFVWYGRLFLNLTQPVSRAQEREADRIAAEIAGAQNAIDALLAMHSGTFAFRDYWHSHVVPVLTCGFRPPIASGLTEFMSDEGMRKTLGEVVSRELGAARSDPYDSHPTLRERVLSLSPQADGVTVTYPLASTLLRDVDALEEDLARHGGAGELRAIGWCDVPQAVYPLVWQRVVREHNLVLRDLTVSGVPRFIPSLLRLAERLGFAGLPDVQAASVATYVLGCALAKLLVDERWTFEGSAFHLKFSMTKNGHTISPFLGVEALASGEMTQAAWEQQCVDAGIAELRLA
jgi:heat shock protein HtpX